VILTVSVVFVVPLILIKAGGVGGFLEKAPDGFLAPVAAEFSWWFIISWMLVNFCVIGAEWTFVQRYLCVPTVKDAKKAAYLFGFMYLVSPVIWMIPPIVFRTLNPDVADTEQAYILACQFVLPAGMMGLMVAAMASATASMATTRLNVFAGAFTSEVYHRRINRGASEKQLVFFGRAVTLILGCIVIAGALIIPKYGYTSFILDINTLLYGPMLMPTIWGLFSRKIGLKAVWTTVLVGFVAAYLIKFGLSESKGGFLAGVGFLHPLVEWIAEHSRIVDRTAGLVVPFCILLFLEIFGKQEHPGWQRVMETRKTFEESTVAKSSTLPGRMVAICLALLAVLMGVLSVINREETGTLVAVTIVLLTIAGTMYRFNR
jgi:Na+/proline symporter